jgi:hypothetical protein
MTLVAFLGLGACGTRSNALEGRRGGTQKEEAPNIEPIPAPSSNSVPAPPPHEPTREIPPVDEVALSKATTALAGLGADEDRAAFAAHAFAELERERVTTLVLEGFTRFANSPPDQRDAVLQQAISTNVEWFEVACEHGDATVLVEMSKRPAKEATSLLIETCGFGDPGLVDPSSAATANAWATALAYTALAQLRSGGAVDAGERTLLVAVLDG